MWILTGNYVGTWKRNMKLYNTSEAGVLLGLSRIAIIQHCKRNNIGKKVGRDWVLTEEDIDQIRDRLGKVGRPKEGTGQ